MSQLPVILKAENIHKSYRMGATRVNVLKGVDLAVHEGEFIAIVGASGSGKSTLLHILGGLDRPDKGVIHFNGRDLNRVGARELNRFRNEKVGFVFQFYHLLDELNVLENVMLPAMISRSVLGWLASPPHGPAAGREPARAVGSAGARRAQALPVVRRRAAAGRHRQGPDEPAASCFWRMSRREILTPRQEMVF